MSQATRLMPAGNTFARVPAYIGAPERTRAPVPMKEWLARKNKDQAQ